jgi:hypothetical protein
MKKISILLALCLSGLAAHSQTLPAWEAGATEAELESAKPWVYYYMMYGAISKAGFAADFEAMKAAGIGGAYLFSIRNTDRLPKDIPEVEISPALSDAWWDKITYAFRKADSLDFKLGFHLSDGFALAGGPWITPELSMQKIVWADTVVDGAAGLTALPVPPHYRDYYVDVAAYAFPLRDETTMESTRNRAATLTTNAAGENNDPSVLVVPGNTRRFSSGEDCWIQYDFGGPFTCRSVEMVYSQWRSQAYPWTLSVSDDGVNFRPVARLEYPRFGWQNGEAPTTYAVPEATARYFRLAWTWEGIEPGAEDIDAAKFVEGPSLLEMHLSGEPKVNQFEGKSAAVWRVGAATTQEQMPESLCVAPSQLIRLTVDGQGRIDASRLPAGRWRILRMGHTSTGKENETAGAARGLECDKFSPEAVQLQFDNWFGMIYNRVGEEVARRTLRYGHFDSWECGSQNWTKNFPEEFKKRRGYDLMPWLPLYAGVPVGSAAESEKVLLDIRETVSELITEVFHEVMKTNVHRYGCLFSTENTAPTHTADGMLHFKQVDATMGEFWFRSPTHDKPTDMLDAIHGGRIYGKNIIAAEAFTQLRTQWDEHPALMKPMADLYYALGVNRMVYHVYVHNPWTTWQPGITLDGIGWVFQRGQSWWPHARGWVDYARRVQLLLQRGRPVVDVAVFTGEDIPRRAVLPDRLVGSLPGIFGAERVESERIRLLNEGHPKHTVYQISSAKNFTPISDWVDPLRGYTYDSFNKDVLLRSKAVNGRMVLPDGASYRVVVFPLADRMTMNDALFRSPEVEAKIRELREGGVVVLTDGAGLPYTDGSFEKYGLERDFVATEDGAPAAGVAWNHRADENSDIYFIANQQDRERTLTLSLRGTAAFPTLRDPVTGESRVLVGRMAAGRTEVSVTLPAGGSLFVELDPRSQFRPERMVKQSRTEPVNTPWRVTFEGCEPQTWPTLTDWTQNDDPVIKYYSGKAVYETDVEWRGPKNRNVYLDLGRVGMMAEVFVNGRSCGIAWTPPYRTNITGALKPGRNTLRVEVTNVWANRLNGIKAGALSGEGVWHSSSYRFSAELIPSGLCGPVEIVTE